MVQLTHLDASPGDDALEDAIRTRLGDLDSGKYRRNNAFVLRQFAAYVRAEEDIRNVEAVTAETLRGYARVLRTAVNEDGITASTAEQYWALVSAFLSWSVREGLLESNPAHLTRASEPLPESDGGKSRQFWSPRERKAICVTADTLVDETLDGGSTETLESESSDIPEGIPSKIREGTPSEYETILAFRNRALVYTLAYTGCRGAELAAVPGDRKRNGVTWDDVDLSHGIISVYGKTRTQQESPIFEPAIRPLERLFEVLEPEADWPVFPSMHLPSLYTCAPTAVDPTPERIWQQLRQHGRTPPAITTAGVRRVLRQLCEESAYEFDEPLKPHGARRGLGDELYREQAELAQDALRHQDVKTTHESYREENVQRVKERGDEILDDSS